MQVFQEYFVAQVMSLMDGFQVQCQNTPKFKLCINGQAADLVANLISSCFLENGDAVFACIQEEDFQAVEIKEYIHILLLLFQGETMKILAVIRGWLKRPNMFSLVLWGPHLFTLS